MLTALGETARFTAEVRDQNGQVMTGAAVAWSTSDASVAPVEASGQVKAAANGNATITATAGAASGTATVTVAQEVRAVAVTPAADTMVTGDTLRLSAEARDANGHAVAVAALEWASSETSVVVVDETGLVTAVAAGAAEITATFSGVTGSAALTVAAPVPATVALTPDTVAFTAIGQTAQLAAEVRDQAGRVMADVPVSWTSADATIATVDSVGLVTAVVDGSATITATGGSASGTATVTVAQEVSAVAVTSAADTMVTGDTLRFSAEARDANGHAVAGAALEWASSDTSVALVDETGLVTAVAAGAAEITATSSGVTGSAALTVAARVPATVAVTPDRVAFTAIGQTAQLAAEVRDQAGRVMADVPVSWTSADATIATVDSVGLVMAVGAGATAVAASAGDASSEAVVSIIQSAGSVVVVPAADTVALGDTLRLVAEAFDENGHAVEGARFTWSSSDASVVTVDASGLLTGVAEGMAMIAATAEDARGIAEITVENPDRAALVALYNATDGPNWVNNENWLTDAPLEDWYGVDTYGPGKDWYEGDPQGTGRVVQLDLRGRWEYPRWTPLGLSGPIPPELGNLTHLRALYLSGNALSGPIPPELGNLTRLVNLYLDGTTLSGPIPPVLGNLTNLRNVSLPSGICVTDDLLAWAIELGLSVSSCTVQGRLLPSALMREDGNGLSLALPDDLHEPSAVTVSDPSVVTVSVADGWLELVPRARGSADVEIAPSGRGAPASARVVVRAAVGTFGIDIVMERPAPVIYEKALMTAADWWSSVLNGTEWPDRRPTCLNDQATAVADELLIHAIIDENMRGAGSAYTCFRPSGEQAALDPGGGRVRANPANANPNLVQHEMGHLLGLVSWGPETGLVTADEAYFVGPRAVEAFRASGGDPDLPGVPRLGPHWGPGVKDFMGVDGGGEVLISVAALADAGYTVDMTKAKPLSATVGASTGEASAAAPAVHHVHDVEPIEPPRHPRAGSSERVPPQ